METQTIEQMIDALNKRFDALRLEIDLLKRQSNIANKRRQNKLDRIDLMAMELSLDVAKLHAIVTGKEQIENYTGEK